MAKTKKRNKKKNRHPLYKYLLALLIVFIVLIIVSLLIPKKALVFKGVVPCADCPGIEQTITLNSNKTYSDQNIYMERNTTYTDEGKWSVVDTQDNKIIYELFSNSGQKKSYYILESNKLSPLDSEMKPLPSPYNTPLVEQ